MKQTEKKIRSRLKQLTTDDPMERGFVDRNQYREGLIDQIKNDVLTEKHHSSYMKIPKVIQVEWIDSHSHSGWAFENEYQEDIKKKTPIISIGFFFSRDNDYLCLVQSYGNEQFNATIQIPIKSIINEKTL